jgi:hypothetical protein
MQKNFWPTMSPHQFQMRLDNSRGCDLMELDLNVAGPTGCEFLHFQRARKAVLAPQSLSRAARARATPTCRVWSSGQQAQLCANTSSSADCRAYDSVAKFSAVLTRDNLTVSLIFRLEDPDGHVVDFHGGDAPLKWKPLGVTEFRKSVINGAPLEMSIRDATTSVAGPVSNFSAQAAVEFVMPNDPPFRVFGLVPGGWLPAAVCESTLMLPDANLAGSFSLLDDEASRFRAQTHLRDVPLMTLGTNLISPMLAAFEAGEGQLPSREELADRVINVAERLQRGFPGRRVVYPTREVINAGFAIIQEILPAHKRDTAFLREVYPLIAHYGKDADLERLHSEVDEAAARSGVRRTTFLYMLVVDCLYDEGAVKKSQQRPGRLVLKPKRAFNEADLFNALSDVMHLEFLCKAHMVDADEQPVLCTMDHGMVQAWALLGPHNMRFEDGKPTYRATVDATFALRMPPQRKQEFFGALQTAVSGESR